MESANEQTHDLDGMNLDIDSMTALDKDLSETYKETADRIEIREEGHNEITNALDDSVGVPESTADVYEENNEFLESFPMVAQADARLIFPCFWCEKVFKRKFDLNRHLSRHTGERSFKCAICYQSFATGRQLKTHRDEAHTPGKEFICSVCFEGFESRIHMSSHMRAVHCMDKVDNYVCEICDIRFDSRKGLKEHDTSIHGRDGQNKCLFCEQRFSYPSDLKRHERKHTGFRPYACNICDKMYPTASQLTKHLQQHLQQKSGQRYFHCGECDKSFTSGGDLKRHIRRIHNPNLPFTCQLCKKVLSSREDYREHRKEAHGINIVPDEFKPVHECQYCGKKFRYPSDIKRHLRTHSNERAFQCEICGKAFKEELYAKRHALSHDTSDVKNVKQKQIECPICNKTFTKAGLNIHMGVHSKDGFPCKQCNEVFKTRTESVLHAKKQHPKLYKCDFCQTKTFKSRQLLDNHLRIHTKETPFQCEICGRQFKQSAHLHGHRITHSVARKETCEFCGKGFAKKSYLRQHMLQHNRYSEKSGSQTVSNALAAVEIEEAGDENEKNCGTQNISTALADVNYGEARDQKVEDAEVDIGTGGKCNEKNDSKT